MEMIKAGDLYDRKKLFNLSKRLNKKATDENIKATIDAFIYTENERVPDVGKIINKVLIELVKK